MDKPPEAVENYLETIFMLGYGGNRVRSVDIANEMEYSKPTISVAMKNLRASGYIAVDENGHITLTESGSEIAGRMYERHKLISDWLMFLGVSNETAVSDACKIEHDISEESFAALQRHIMDKAFKLDSDKSPAAAHEEIPAQSHLEFITKEQVFSVLPPRSKNSHKGVHGRLLNISGSLRYRGAATLSCLGALRSGVGLMVLASTEAVCEAVAHQLPEVIFCPLPASKSGNICSRNLTAYIGKELAFAKAVLIGCGLGDGVLTGKILEYVLANAKCPIVIDADGLNALSRNICMIKKTTVPIVLTPHPGEMSRLCGVSTATIEKDRSGFAERFASEHGVVLVLKGHRTVIALPSGELRINQTGNPGLAKGGSGDVLAGMIASFIAQGLSAADASTCGVFLHGLASDQTAKRRGEYAMLPSEIVIDLAKIMAENGR